MTEFKVAFRRSRHDQSINIGLLLFMQQESIIQRLQRLCFKYVMTRPGYIENVIKETSNVKISYEI